MKRTFRKDYEFGTRGERYIQQRYGLKSATSGRRGDVWHPNGEKIEVKTENYPRTGNLAIETDSREERKLLGGPYQALLNRCKYYMHAFFEEDCPVAGLEFWFNTIEVVRFMNLTMLKYREVRKAQYDDNGKFDGTTLVRIVPIADIEHLCFPPEKLGLVPLTVVPARIA